MALALLLLPQRDSEFRGDTACRSGRRGLRRWGRRHCGDAQDLDRRLGGYRRRETSLGSILVNSTGRTLYLFKADVGTKSGCSGACATAWPPLLGSGKPTAATGPTASKLVTITRSDGSQQVTDNGHPVYQFIKDQKPGQTAGQGVTAFGAAWFALAPSGTQISATPPSPTSGGSSGGGR